MTNSDQLMLSAIKAGVPFKINGREVAVDGEKTTVKLHDEEIVVLFWKEKRITLSGKAKVSRKSARVINTILREYTSFEMTSTGGQWVLIGDMGEPMPVNRIGVVVQMKT